jgi:endonuclease YncB( thermonuclease family)
MFFLIWGVVSLMTPRSWSQGGGLFEVATGVAEALFVLFLFGLWLCRKSLLRGISGSSLQRVPDLDRALCRVSRVVDGDTVLLEVVIPDSVAPHDPARADVFELRGRLSNIDAPELNQAGGERAKVYLESLVSREEFLYVTSSSTDRYGRHVVTLHLRNGDSVNELMVSAGQAMAYPWGSHSRYFQRLESSAKHRRVGLWSERNPLTPWEFRKQNA